MKRKLLTVLLAVISAVCLICIAGCNFEKHEHNFTGGLIPIKYATCTETGVKAHYHCKSCEKNFDVNLKDELTDEKLIIPIDTNAHSLNEGESNCSDCGAPLTQGLKYSLIANGTYSVTEGDATDSNIIVPAKYKGKLVTIAHHGFMNSNTLESIIIPNTTIGERAFFNCKKLKSITISSSLYFIDNLAFDNCTSLTGVYITDVAAWCNIEFGKPPESYEYGQSPESSQFGSLQSNPLTYAHNLYLNNNLVTKLEIPQGVTQIKNYAFAYCTSITSITIPDSVTYIGWEAIAGNTNLTGIYISDIAAWCNIGFLDLILFDVDLYLNGKLVSEITADMLQGVIEIKPNAFAYCKSITNVTIPDSVITIGFMAFYRCDNLESVTFENTEGWKIRENDNPLKAKDIDVTSPEENAKKLSSEMCMYCLET